MSKTTIEDVLKKHWLTMYGNQKSGYEGSLFKANESWVKAAMQEWASLQTPSNEDAGIAAVRLSESIEPKLTANEQAFFIAGFQECIKWLNESTPIPVLTPCVELEKEVIGFEKWKIENEVEYNNGKYQRWIPFDLTSKALIYYSVEELYRAYKKYKSMPLPTKPNL